MVPPLAILSKGCGAKPCRMIAQVHEGNVAELPSVGCTGLQRALRDSNLRYFAGVSASGPERAQARWNKLKGKLSRDTETVWLPKLFRYHHSQP
jgi:hypothetical protein